LREDGPLDHLTLPQLQHTGEGTHLVALLLDGLIG
jgi:hypothetical protein